ncbi:hypothetical protein KUTeg_018566, partial [Tegillarca granosa]
MISTLERGCMQCGNHLGCEFRINVYLNALEMKVNKTIPKERFFRRLCGMGPPPVRPNFTVLCLGLSNSGKSTLLAVLSGESADSIRPTIGFSIKALMFDECFVDVKELGGGDTVRPYWDKYYLGAQGVIFVVDSSADEDSYKIASTELHNALADPELDRLPLLVLCNFQDKPGARKQDE